MFSRPVSGISEPPVGRIANPETSHEFVATNLGHDGSAPDGVHGPVSTHHRLMGKPEPGEGTPIDDEARDGTHRKGRHGSAHGPGRGFGNSNPVDFPCRRGPHSDPKGDLSNLFREASPPDRRNRLRVSRPVHMDPRGEDHRCGHHGTRERPPPHLIDADKKTGVRLVSVETARAPDLLHMAEEFPGPWVRGTGRVPEHRTNVRGAVKRR
jgi:hypothetical protein